MKFSRRTFLDFAMGAAAQPAYWKIVREAQIKIG